MSASAMVGVALVALLSGTIRLLLVGDVFYQKKRAEVFGIPNTSMSSWHFFPRFGKLSWLDKKLSGIPNTIKRVPGGSPDVKCQRSHCQSASGGAPDVQQRCRAQS